MSILRSALAQVKEQDEFSYGSEPEVIPSSKKDNYPGNLSEGRRSRINSEVFTQQNHALEKVQIRPFQEGSSDFSDFKPSKENKFIQMKKRESAITC
jgi:hypothetical protein